MNQRVGQIAGLWQQRGLLAQFTLRNIELRHRGSHLGLLWSLLNPLLMLGLYLFVFGYIFGGQFNPNQPETRLEYGLALFLGLSIFHLFAEILALAPAVIVANPNFVKKVVFPLEILPLSVTGAALFHGVISLGLVLLGIGTLGPGLTLSAFWLPVLLLPVALLMAGAAWLLAALGVFLRDIGQLVGFVSMALLFASAVFYPVEGIPPAAWKILRFNPILLVIDMARDALMWHHPVNLIHFSYVAGLSVAVCAIGYACFRKMAPAFADVL